MVSSIFNNIPTEISSQVVAAVFINRDCSRITPLTIDATPLNYTSKFTDRTGNNRFNSTFIDQESLNGTINLKQQDIQTPSQFKNEEIVETMPTTTQQSISPIHPTLTFPRNQKHSISTNNYTIHGKTFRYSKEFTNGLSNI